MVDAGAYGLTVIVAGVVAALRGEDATELAHREAPPHAESRHEHESSTFRYCTNFAVTGEGLDRQPFTPLLEALGDSVLVVGDERTLRVHVHTDDPEAPWRCSPDAGDRVAARRGRHARAGGRPRRARLAKSDARLLQRRGRGQRPGIVRLYRELGVSVLDGGPTMNPSTYELLAAIHAADGEQVVVLPNSPNVLMAAERAAELSDLPAHVVPPVPSRKASRPCWPSTPRPPPSATPPPCGTRPPVCASAEWRRPPGPTLRGASRWATPWATARDELVAWGDPAATLRATLAEVASGAELLTCLVGEGAPLGRDAIEAAVPDGVELDFHEGGQPAWWWLLCAE